MAIRCLLSFLLLPLSAMGAQNEDRESFAVMTAVLDSLYRSHGDRPSIVVVSDSLHWREGGVVYKGKLLLPHAAHIDSSTAADFGAKTDRSTFLPFAFKYPRLRRFAGSDYKTYEGRGEEIKRTTPDRVLNEMPFWLAFTESYPLAWGITYLSPVGFNENRSEALTYVRHNCGGGCFSSEAVLLRKFKPGWTIVERINNASSDAMGSGSMRYLGPGARLLADLRKRKDSVRLAIADSIRRDRAPRRIRGTIVSRQTGFPIGFAQIFAHTHRWPGEAIRRFVADAHGRYEIRNPLIGGTMLEVQCPGPIHRVGTTLDAPSFYVFPEIDTVINMGPPNIQPCWREPRVHAIESGELSSAGYNGSPYPSERETSVYAAIIGETQAKDDAASWLVNAETVAWCGRFHECPLVHVAHLVRAGLFDSTTLRNFRAVSNDTVPLNPAAVRTLGPGMLSNGELIYLKQEAARKAMTSDPNQAPNVWPGLKSIYPDVKSIVSFTRVGFNASGDEAMASVRTRTESDRRAETMMLRRVQGVWRVIRRHMEDESITGALVADRCVPDQVGAPPTREDLTSILGDYDFTLVSSAVNDRVSQWRMRFVRDTARGAGPVPAFQVLDPTTGLREIHSEPGTHVESGKIHFANDARMFQFDGSGYSFYIRGVANGRLFGQWEHYGYGIPIGRNGRATPEPAGHFCAVRRGPQERNPFSAR